MRKGHFFAILIFCIAAVAISFRPFYALTWGDTGSNQMVTRAALLNAVQNGVFTANTTIPNDTRLVTREMAQAYVNIQPITSYSMNRLVPKSAFVAATVYYTHEGYFLCFSDSYSTGAGYTSSANALAYNPLDDYLIGFRTLYNRPLQVGDQLYRSGSLDPAVVDDGGPCYATANYWFYYPSLNAAVRATATNTGNQYVVEIVYPSGSTNVSICLVVDISGSTATVQAVASAAVNTTVTIDWNYNINGTEAVANPLTITGSSSTSNVENINHGSTINTMTVSINSFSPTSSGTQNYISGGTCN